MRKSPRKKKNVSYMEFNREEPLSESEEEEEGEAEEDLPTPEKKTVKKTGVKAAKTGTTTGKPAGKTTKPTKTNKTTKTTKTAAKTTKGHRDSSPDDSQNSQGRKRQDNWQLQDIENLFVAMESHRDVLKSTGKSGNGIRAKKKKAWEEIAGIVTFCPFTSKQNVIMCTMVFNYDIMEPCNFGNYK